LEEVDQWKLVLGGYILLLAALFSLSFSGHHKVSFLLHHCSCHLVFCLTSGSEQWRQQCIETSETPKQNKSFLL
jgi:hypothetical protein